MGNFRFELVFIHSGSANRHRSLMGMYGHLDRLAHQIDLIRTLAQTHFMQHTIQGHEFFGWLGTGPCLSTQGVDRRHHLLIQFGVHPNGIVDQTFAVQQGR